MARCLRNTAYFFVLLSGCTLSNFPSRVGSYRLEEGARDALKTYSNEVLRNDFEKMAEHVFSITDANEDGFIDSDEAYETINLMRPYTKKFREELLAIGAEGEREVVKSD